MMPRLLSGLLVLVAVGAPVSVLRLAPRARSLDSAPAVPPMLPPAFPAPEAGARALLLAVAEEQTPFRPEGELPFLRFGESPPPPVAPPPAVERPKLSVSGIVWGAEPVAIVEGLPGREWPIALAQGGAEGGFRVTRIERDRVTITGMDTVWVLRVREAW